MYDSPSPQEKISAVHARRLRKLADFVQHNLADDEFDMQMLANTALNETGGVKVLTARCGSVFCAAGSMPLVFPRQLKYVPSSGSELDYGRLFAVVPKSCKAKTVESCWDRTALTAMVFLGLSKENVNRLFLPERYETHGRKLGRRTVAARIRKYAKLLSEG